MKEKWKWVKNYRGHYKISNYGRLKSVDKKVINKLGRIYFFEGKYLKETPGRYGHLLVYLCRNGKRKNFMIHRLVLEAFVGPCPEGMEARHFPDRDPENNKISNLSWTDRLTNQHDRIIHGTTNKGINHYTAKLTPYKVELIKRWRTKNLSFRHIARLLEVGQTTVFYAYHGKTWK